MATIDFSSIGGKQVGGGDSGGVIDFSSIGGKQVGGDAPTSPTLMQEIGSAMKRGATDAVGALAKTPMVPANALRLGTSVPPDQLYDKTKNYLPAIGGAIGAIGGPPGIAIGAGAGSILKQAGGVAFNDPATMKYITPGQNFNIGAGLRAGGEALLGGAGEVAGIAKAAPGALPYATRAVNAVGDALAPAGEAVKQGVAKLSQAFTGVPSRQAVKLMDNPSTILAPFRLNAAGKGVESAESAMDSKLPAEITSAITTNQGGIADKIVTNLLTKAKTAPGAISTEEALAGIQSIDRTLPAPTRNNAKVLQQYYDLRSNLSDVIAKNEPKYQAAKSVYNDAKVGADFRNIFPRTMTGNVSTVKTVLPTLLDLKRGAALPFTGGLTSPAVHGAAMAAGAGAVDAAKFAVSDPAARRSLISAYIENSDDNNK